LAFQPVKMIPGRVVVADTTGTMPYNRLPGEQFHSSSIVCYYLTDLERGVTGKGAQRVSAGRFIIVGGLS
jgi:hypothetical protein